MSIRWQVSFGGHLIGLLSSTLALVSAWSQTIPAMAAEPSANESGFVALTGSDAREHWSGYGLDKEKDTWPPNWEFADGMLHSKGGGGADLKTREQYGDFDLRFDWKVSPGANSGVMYRVSQETDPAYFTGPSTKLSITLGTPMVLIPRLPRRRYMIFMHRARMRPNRRVIGTRRES
jgi:hypothetical protein